MPNKEETKKKMSESRKKYLTDNKHPCLGKRVTEETKKKISKNNARFWLGKKRSEKDIKNIKAGMTPKTSFYNSKPVVAVCLGKEYRFNTYSEAGRSNILDNPVHPTNITKFINTNRSSGKINGEKVYWKSV